MGHLGSGKSTIINGIYKQSNINLLQDEDIKDNDLIMRDAIVSQYEIDNFAIISEYTVKSIRNYSAQNLKYWNLFKDEFTEFTESVQDYFATKMEKLQITSDTIRNDTANVNDYSLLFSGFIHQFEDSEDAFIPLDVVRLVSKYYVPNILAINCYKFGLERTYHPRYGNPNTIRYKQAYEFWESSGIDIKYWKDKIKRIKCVIYLVDLTTYDEYFVDDDGMKKNKLEYSLKKWQDWGKKIGYDDKLYSYQQKIKLNALMLLTKKDLFMKKIKNIPFNVCPMFQDYSELNTLSRCLGPIKDKIKSFDSYGYNRVYTVNSFDTFTILKYFQTMQAKMPHDADQVIERP